MNICTHRKHLLAENVTWRRFSAVAWTTDGLSPGLRHCSDITNFDGWTAFGCARLPATAYRICPSITGLSAYPLKYFAAIKRKIHICTWCVYVYVRRRVKTNMQIGKINANQKHREKAQSEIQHQKSIWMDVHSYITHLHMYVWYVYADS